MSLKASALTALDDLVTPGRVRGYAAILLAGYAIALVAMVLTLRQGLDPSGNPLGSDFIIFYTASALALKGKAVLAWSASAILIAEREVVPASRGLFIWCYPPTFLLMIAPLAKLTYPAALAAWLGVTGGLYLGMTRLISRDPRAWWLALAFPGTFVAVIQGQNGLLSAAILGTGLLLLDRRPWLAGAILGLIAYKPHLGLLLPLLLFGTGRWKSALSTGVCAAALVALSALAFGTESWMAFLQSTSVVRQSLESGALPLAKMPSVFAAARMLGGGLALAYGLQATAGVAVAALTLLAWRRPGPLALKAGLAVTATLLAEPYLFDYDLVLLAVPAGAMAVQAMRGGAPSGTKIAVAIAAFTPLALPALAAAAHLPLMPVALALVYAQNWRTLYARQAGEAKQADGALGFNPA